MLGRKDRPQRQRVDLKGPCVCRDQPSKACRRKSLCVIAGKQCVVQWQSPSAMWETLRSSLALVSRERNRITFAERQHQVSLFSFFFF